MNEINKLYKIGKWTFLNEERRYYAKEVERVGLQAVDEPGQPANLVISVLWAEGFREMEEPR